MADLEKSTADRWGEEWFQYFGVYPLSPSASQTRKEITFANAQSETIIHL